MRLRQFARALAAFALPLLAGRADELADGFAHPPADARPQTWWHWMNGNISKEGITADLEAMKRIGLGGAQIFNANQGEAPGPVQVLSPEWRDLVKHAITEADRLGLEITMHNCAGWSESGGPWVTPAQAMQRVVWSELRVHGPTTLAVDLPAPTLVVANYSADIAVLAFPANPAEVRPVTDLVSSIAATAPGVDVRPLFAGTGRALAELPMPKPDAPQVLTVNFTAPQLCGSVRLVGREYMSMPVNGRIEASDDGQTYRVITEFPELARGRNHPSMLITFPETRAQSLRIVVTKVDARARGLVLTAVELGGGRLPHTEEAAGFRADARIKFVSADVPAADMIARDRIVDLSAQTENGHLTWNVPAGDWTIVRFAHTPTGQMNAPAPESARGWECDKMSRAAVDAHFNALMGKIIADVGPLAGKAFRAVLADSWEAGSQNWTPDFRAEFLKRRGYDPLPYLPVIAGRVVGDTETSERFLWDYRRTIGDLIAENHYAEFQKLCRAHGMYFTSEAPGIGMPTIADELESKGRTDVPMGEFWMDGHNDSKETAAAAHVYGKAIAAAEAFTAKTEDAKWTKTPFDHKQLGDLHFTLGINRYVFHRYAHQPWLDRVPGMTMGRWGTNFERTNTWWEQARAWMEYVTRCQYLLQRGKPFADICYFYGENVPNTLARNEPALPAGYDYDACNAEVLLTRLSVRDGRLVLPDGVSYAVLLLADSDRMSPPVLRKLKELVAAGATVIGRRPERSPSLVNYPHCDDEVRQLAAELWGDCDGRTVKEHRVGAGRVVWGVPVGDVLAAKNLAPDFSWTGEGRFAAIHRTIGDAEVYFVSSQNAGETDAPLTFRLGDRAPELWYPDSGRIERVANFIQAEGRTTVPLHFDPAGSVFVVFRPKRGALDPIVRLTRDGNVVHTEVETSMDEAGRFVLATAEPGAYVATTLSGRQRRAVVPNLPAPTEISGAWTLRFPAGWGAPAEVPWPSLVSWTTSNDDGIKYFSGTATYSTSFDVAPGTLGRQRELLLDLGVIHDVAELRVNGRNLGVLWKPPYRANVTAFLHDGTNSIEVRITNLWPNRLIGDQRLPQAQRHTWATFNPYKADSPLLESGLLGPVRLLTKARVVLE